jgi:hypothetical protein
MAAKATMAITITLPMMINVVVFIRIIPTFLANPGFEFGILHLHELSRGDIPSSKGLLSVPFRTLRSFYESRELGRDQKWKHGPSLVCKNDLAMFISTLVNSRQR